MMTLSTALVGIAAMRLSSSAAQVLPALQRSTPEGLKAGRQRKRKSPRDRR